MLLRIVLLTDVVGHGVALEFAERDCLEQVDEVGGNVLLLLVEGLEVVFGVAGGSGANGVEEESEGEELKHL